MNPLSSLCIFVPLFVFFNQTIKGCGCFLIKLKYVLCLFTLRVSQTLFIERGGKNLQILLIITSSKYLFVLFLQLLIFVASSFVIAMVVDLLILCV